MSPPMEGWHASAGVGISALVCGYLRTKPRSPPCPSQGGDAAAYIALLEGMLGCSLS